MKSATNCTIIGPKAEASRIPGLDLQVADGDSYAFGSIDAKVIETPGHTAGHIAYWFPDAQVAFVGDTLIRDGMRTSVRGERRADVAVHLENHEAAT